MGTLGDDRRFVLQLYETLFDRPPTGAELNRHVKALQGGMSYNTLEKRLETTDREASVTRVYMATLQRPPTAKELAWHSNGLRIGRTTRKSLTQHLLDSSEHVLKKEPAPGPTKDQEDARATLNEQLRGYGLGGLADWAWEQIQAGNTKEQIHQDLVKQDVYKKRFAGMAQRQARGLSSISEDEYIAYETQVRQMMLKAGMPVSFYDQPDDFANMIGKDISPMEMQARIEEGYLAASQAPEGVRSKLASLYGINTSQLAAYYLDPERALPILQRQLGSAQIANAAVGASYGDISRQEAERLEGLGVGSEQATQGFGTLAASAELFEALPGERVDDITRDEQMGAVFQGDAKAIGKIERKAGSRRSAGSGSQSFVVGDEGVGGLSRR